MKLDLCKVFGVEEGQHFFIKAKCEKYEDATPKECMIKNNELYEFFVGEKYKNKIKINDIDEIYYTEPIGLNENTRQFLKLIDKKYKWIVRDRCGTIKVYANKPKKNIKNDKWEFTIFSPESSIIEGSLDIDLSFIQWEDEEPTLISDLLGDDK